MSAPIRGAGGGKSNDGARTPVEATDSLRSKQFAHILDLVSEGEIYGLVNGAKSVYLNETPLQNADGTLNFKDVHLYWTTGTQTQGGKTPGANAISFGTEDVRYENLVNVEVRQATPVVRSISDANIGYVVVTLSVPALQQRNLANGDLNGASVALTIDVQANGGGYVNKVNDTISGKTSSKYQRAYSIALTGAAPWDIRVTRTTPDSVIQTLDNKTWWDTYTGVIPTHLSYPNSAIVSTSIDSQQFQTIPTRGYDIKGLVVRVPTNYDPLTRIYSGLWDGTFKLAWSDNPAWCYFDLVTSTRYGLGSFIDSTQIDKWGLYTISQYCDGMVPTGFRNQDGSVKLEPRFTCNLYLQSAAEAYTVVQNFASIFRAITFWAAGVVKVVQDAPATAIALFTNANVIDGAFNYVGSSIKARRTVAYVAWNDPSDFYRQKIEYAADDDAVTLYGIKPAQITAFGCTSRGQAHRLGQWLLYSEKNETEVATFRTSLEAAALYPGALINTSDINRAQNRMGGRIKAIAGSVLTLDAAVTIATGRSYSISIMLEDGSLFSSAVTGALGATATLTLTAALPAQPVVNAVFIFAADNLVPEVWRVVGITEVEPNIVEISAIQHAAQKFALIENGVAFTPAPTTAANSAQLITNIVATESLYVVSNAGFGVRVGISWTSTSPRFSVRYKPVSGGAWVERMVLETAADFTSMSQIAYTFEVTAIDGLGRKVDTQSYTYTVLGLAIPPANVAGFSASMEPFGTRFNWTNNVDVDLDHYEIRVGGSNWGTASPMISVKAATALMAPMAAASYPFWIKAIDTTGNYSVTEAGITVVVAAPAVVTPIARVAGQNAVLTWQPVTGSYSIDHYELRYGASWAAGVVLDLPKSAQFIEKISYGGTRTYWIAAVDVAGNVGPASSVQITIANPLNTVATAQVIDNNVLLNWSDSTSTLPIVKYDIRRGATWLLGVTIGDNGNGRFAGFFEQASGIYNYWVMATDTAGNTSVPASITATVSQPPDYILRLDYAVDFGGLLYEFASDTQGWTGSGDTVTQQPQVLHVVSTGAAPVITKQLNAFILYGCEYPTIQVRLRRIAGAGWVGNCQYDTAAHAISASYLATTADTSPAIGELKVVTFNMAALTVGGQDWMASIINDVQFQFGNSAADIFDIDWIRLVPYTANNVTRDNASLYAALTTESWASHFTGNAWSTPQDQITAGFPYFWEKSNTSGYYEEIVDYGSTLVTTAVTATLTAQTLAGTVTVTPKISTKLLWSDAWTDSPGVASVVATNFRYVKMRYDFTATGGANLLNITNINLKLSSKKRRDSGTGTALAGDVGGTVVNFTLPFVSAQTPFVQAVGNQAVFAAADYVAIVNPTFFKVLLFDRTGARITGNFSWGVDGVF
jgi:predicted phage tail protein